MKYRLFASVPAVVSGLVLHAGLIYSEPSVHRWTPVPGAAYYEGTISGSMGTSRVRTRDTWLMTEPGDTLDLSGYSDDGSRLGPAYSTGTPTAAEAVPQSDEPLPPPASPPDGAGQNSFYEEAESADPGEAVAPPPEEDPAAQAPGSAVALLLAFGNESLKSDAGITAFDGKANTGGTTLVALHQQRGQPWIMNFILSMHSFTATVTKTDDATGESRESDETYLRLAARLGALYDVFRPENAAQDSQDLFVGAGIGVLRMPVLSREDDKSGTGELTPYTVIGPYLAARYALRPSAEQEAGLDLAWMPWALSPGTRGTMISASAYYRHDITRSLFTLLVAGHARASLNREFDCPDLADCEDRATSDTRLNQVMVGLGLHL